MRPAAYMQVIVWATGRPIPMYVSRNNDAHRPDFSAIFCILIFKESRNDFWLFQ